MYVSKCLAQKISFRNFGTQQTQKRKGGVLFFFHSCETVRAHRNLVSFCSRMNSLDNIPYLSTLFKRISILRVPNQDQFFLFSPLRPGILWSLFKGKSLSRILPQRFIFTMLFRTEKNTGMTS